MRELYIFCLSLTISFLTTTNIKGQVVVFDDNFDNYIAGEQLSCQAPTIWKTWTNSPCNTTEDPFVSNSYSFSSPNSVLIVQKNDIVHEIGTPISSGIAEINFQVFIPTGKAGYFNTLANFDPPNNYAWAMQVFLNSPGTGTLDAAGQNSATFSYPQNKWFPVKVVADLTADVGEFWINGTKIHSWQWSKGTFGTSNDKRLDGTDFYGYSTSDEMYIDDYNITHIPYTTKISSTTTGGNWKDRSTWVGGKIPAQNQSVEIVNGATVTLTSNITNRNKSTIINGNLVCGNYILSGSGDFILAGGGTLQIGSANGISTSGSTGNIQMTGTRTFNQYANYVYNGSVAQVTGNGLPSSVNSLTINNAAGVTLYNNITVSGTLNLNNGNLFTNSNNLSLGTSVTNLGVLNSSAGSVIGNFNRWISDSIATVLFPVSTSPGKYTPVTLTNVVGSGTFLVNAVNGIHPNTPSADYLQMYWKLTNGGITSADITFHYLQADVVGDEASYELYKYNGSWIPIAPITLDIETNTASVNGVTSFSDWTLGIENPLPVELTSFSATTIGSKVKLSWNTATEINNYGFEIERSALSAERQAWEKIGFVNGNGNSNSPKSYSFLDNNVTTGKYLYRLKQIDNDGQFEYSKTVEVNFNAPKKFELSQNYPNPFNPTTTISYNIPEASNVKLTIYNLLGQEIKTLVNGFKEAGVHTVNFNASELNSGLYIYKLQAGSYTQTRKMTLIK